MIKATLLKDWLNSEKLATAEKVLFFCFLVYNLYPLTAGPFFPTLDSPAHLYNAHTIKELLLDSTFLDKFYYFNRELVPNWTGHFLLSFFNFFLPMHWAEKLFLLLYLIFLPLSFRWLIKSVAKKENFWICYFIFPFTYSSVLFLGFYNFSIALIFFFLTLNIWIKNIGTNSFLFYLKIGLLVTVTYFSHLFVFALLILLISLYTILHPILNKATPNEKIEFGQSIKKLFYFFLCILFPFTNSVIFYLKRSGENVFVFKTKQELIRSLMEMRSIIGLNIGFESKYTIVIFWVLIALLVLKFSKEIYKAIQIKKWKIENSMFWFLATSILIALYFCLPDSDKYSGGVSIRIEMFLFIALILWISSSELLKYIGIVVVPIILFVSFSLNQFYRQELKRLNEVVALYNEMSFLVKDNSVLLPLNYTDDWYFGHFSNYLGINRRVFILDNYEAGTGYFPLRRFEKKDLPKLRVGKSLNNEEISCIGWNSRGKKGVEPINYIFVAGSPLIELNETCSDSLQNYLKKDYKSIFKNNLLQLYERRN